MFYIYVTLVGFCGFIGDMFRLSDPGKSGIGFSTGWV